MMVARRRVYQILLFLAPVFCVLGEWENNARHISEGLLPMAPLHSLPSASSHSPSQMDQSRRQLQESSGDSSGTMDEVTGEEVGGKLNNSTARIEGGDPGGSGDYGGDDATDVDDGDDYGDFDDRDIDDVDETVPNDDSSKESSDDHAEMKEGEGEDIFDSSASFDDSSSVDSSVEWIEWENFEDDSLEVESNDNSDDDSQHVDAEVDDSSVEDGPILSDVFPNRDKSKGGTVVYGIGSNFVPEGEPCCMFGKKSSKAVFLSSQLVQCTVPPGPHGEVELSIWMSCSETKGSRTNVIAFQYYGVAESLEFRLPPKNETTGAGPSQTVVVELQDQDGIIVDTSEVVFVKVLSPRSSSGATLKPILEEYQSEAVHGVVTFEGFRLHGRPGTTYMLKFCSPSVERCLNWTTTILPCENVLPNSAAVRYSCECQPGFGGTDLCPPCPNGYFKPKVGMHGCTPCPHFTDTAGKLASTSISQCVCQPNYYLAAGGGIIDGKNWSSVNIDGSVAERGDTSCQQCPPASGVSCPGGWMFQVLPGWWTNDPLHLPMKCPNERACKGNVVPRNMTSEAHEWLSVECDSGYRGPLCAVCDDEFISSGNQCIVCTHPILSGIGVTTAIILIFVIIYRLAASNLPGDEDRVGHGGGERNLSGDEDRVGHRTMEEETQSADGEDSPARLERIESLEEVIRSTWRTRKESEVRDSAEVRFKILVSYLQVNAYIGGFDLKWKRVMLAVFDLFEVALGGLQLSSFSCIFRWSFYGQLGALFAFPAVAVPLVVYVIKNRSRIVSLLNDRFGLHLATTETSSQVSILPLAAKVFLAVQFVTFPTVTEYVLKLHDCVPIFGSARMRSKMTIVCDTPQHTSWQVVGTLYWVLNAAVALVLVPATLFRYRRDVRHPDVWPLVFLIEGYTTWFWEFIIIGRKLAIVLLLVILDWNPLLQSYFATWIFATAILLHMTYKPYEDPKIAKLETVSLVLTFINLQIGLIYHSEHFEELYLAADVLLLLINAGFIITIVLNLTAIMWSRLRNEVSHRLAVVKDEVRAGFHGVSDSPGIGQIRSRMSWRRVGQSEDDEEIAINDDEVVAADADADESTVNTTHLSQEAAGNDTEPPRTTSSSPT